MNLYKLWKYKHWIAIAVLSFICIGQLAHTNHLAGELIKADQKQADAVASAIKPYEAAINKAKVNAEKVSAEYEATKNEERIKTEVITREVQKIIERPVYKQSCFDSDGVRAVNRASNTSQPETALP